MMPFFFLKIRAQSSSAGSNRRRSGPPRVRASSAGGRGDRGEFVRVLTDGKGVEGRPESERMASVVRPGPPCTDAASVDFR
jgi:hypothetical protein